MGENRGFEPSEKSRLRGDREALKPCVFCEFARNTIGLDDLCARDETIYLVHLKTSHGLER